MLLFLCGCLVINLWMLWVNLWSVDAVCTHDVSCACEMTDMTYNWVTKQIWPNDLTWHIYFEDRFSFVSLASSKLQCSHKWLCWMYNKIKYLWMVKGRERCLPFTLFIWVWGFGEMEAVYQLHTAPFHLKNEVQRGETMQNFFKVP